MKRSLKHYAIVFMLLVYSQSNFAQVGIGNTDPKAILDITASNQATPSNTDGILIPRIDNFPITNPTAAQQGMIVYLTTTSGGNPPGFYYWDNGIGSWASVTGVKKINNLTDGKTDFSGRSIFLGTNAGSNDSGASNDNVGVGFKTLNLNISGTNNTAIGNLALNKITGNYNTALGSYSLNNNTIGQYNTAIGGQSLISNVTGEENTAIGTFSGNNNLGSGNIFIGYSSGSNETGSNKLYIENRNNNEDNALVYGEFDNNILRVNGELQLGTTIANRYFLPTARGTANQILQTNGAGQLSFRNPDGTGTDDQNLQTPSLTGTTLNLYIQDGTGTSIDLAPILDGTGTDNQGLQLPTLTGTTLNLNIENGAGTAIDLAPIQDGIGTDNQNISGSGLSGTDLTIGIENGTSQVINLASLQDGTGTDDQTIDTFSFNTGTNVLTLEVENDGVAAQTVNLSTLQDGTGTDDQTIDTFSFNTGTNVLTLEVENDGVAAQTVNLSSLNNNDADWYEAGTTSTPNAITDDIYTQGKVAIGTNTPNANYNFTSESNLGNTNTLIGGLSKAMEINTDGGATNGLQVNLTGAQNASDRFGIETNLHQSLTTKVGFLDGNPSNKIYGIKNDVTIGNTYEFNGVKNYIVANQSTFGVPTNSGFANDHRGTGGGIFRGLDNKFSNTGGSAKIGVYNTFSNNVAGNLYGTYSVFGATINSVNKKYGNYVKIPNTVLGTHYGYYADVTKADGYAAYYLGRVSIGTATTNNYLLPLSRGSNGQIMQINGNQVSFIDPATIGDGIGTDNQTIDKLNLNGTTLEISLLNDGVIDETVDLSSLQDGTGTDNQTINKLNLNGTTLEISLLNDGVVDETVDLSSLQDGIGATKIDELTDGKSDVSGSSIFLGINAGLVDNGSNNDNIGIGLNALKTSTTGEGNVAIGSQSLEANINSRYNIAIGTRALSTTTISGQNLAIGYESLEVSTGDSNVAVGHQALNANVAGANNVAIGHKAGLLNVGANNIFIGKGAGSQELTANHKLYIENSDSTYPLIYGDFSAGSVGINWNSTIALTNILSVNGSNVSKSTAGSWLANSDRRLKNEITTINTKTALDKISKMRGVTYKWNDDKTGLDRPTEIQYGFIAQELMEVFPTKVTKDKLGYYQTAYGDYDPLFVQAIKELQNIIHKQETKIEALEATLNTKESAFNILNKRLEKIEVLLINKKNNH